MRVILLLLVFSTLAFADEYSEALLELRTAPKQPPVQQAQQPSAQTWTTIRLDDGTKLKACVPAGVTGQIILVLPSGAEIKGWIH